MLGLGPHAIFIIGAYAMTFAALGLLTVAVAADDRKQRRQLADLERQGVTRRSAKRQPAATATVTRTAPSTAKEVT